jgi:hypothetical protein
MCSRASPQTRQETTHDVPVFSSMQAGRGPCHCTRRAADCRVPCHGECPCGAGHRAAARGARCLLRAGHSGAGFQGEPATSSPTPASSSRAQRGDDRRAGLARAGREMVAGDQARSRRSRSRTSCSRTTTPTTSTACRCSRRWARSIVAHALGAAYLNSAIPRGCGSKASRKDLAAVDRRDHQARARRRVASRPHRDEHRRAGASSSSGRSGAHARGPVHLPAAAEGDVRGRHRVPQPHSVRGHRPTAGTGSHRSTRC